MLPRIARVFVFATICALSALPALAQDDAPVTVPSAIGEFEPPRRLDIPDVEAEYAPDLETLLSAKGMALLEITPEELDEQRCIGRSCREMVEYDLRAAVERRHPASSEALPGTYRTQTGEGVLGDAKESPGAAKDYSGYTLVGGPQNGIYPRHVKLFMKFKRVDGADSWRSCSGTLIGPNHVITAGHCIYTFGEDPDGTALQPWAVYVEAAPGWDGNYGPAGRAFATDVRTWSGWTDNADFDHDVALLTLSRPLGAMVGWRNLGATSDWNYFDSSTWESFTYPGSDYYDNQIYSGDRMYTQSGNYDYDDDLGIGMNRPGYKGTSGGGAIKENAVWAVRSHLLAYPDGDIDTYDTRLTGNKYADIATWRDQDLPAVSDLVPMDVQVSPGVKAAGLTLDDFDFLVHNRSDATHIGGIAYTVYLSTNNTITSNDTYVTSGYASNNIAAEGSLRITVPQVVVPPQLATGDYFFGVIITTSDYNIGNNMTREQDVFPFSVVCAAQGIPQPAFPVDDHPCVPTDITLDWGSIPGTSIQYELAVGTQPWNTQTVQITSSTQFTVLGLNEATYYFWRVRAITQCGGPGAWSDSFRFRTEGFLDEVSLLSPAPDASCLSSSVTLTWDPKPTADYYRVRFQNADTGVVQILDTPTPSYTVTGLAANTHYLWTVKARDACLQWGKYGHRSAFYTSASTALAAVPLEPIADAFTGADPLFKTQFEAGALEYQYEVETLTGSPVNSWSGPWASQLSGLAEDLYRWRVRISTCTPGGNLLGPWSNWQTFEVDLTPPVFAESPTALSPPVGQWTSNDLVSVEFSAATDNCCVAEYWIAWDQSPDTVPDGTITTTTASSWEAVVPEGQNWFHLVAVDGQGNVSAAEHLGPFLVDMTPPSVPVPTANIEALTPANVQDINVSWPASTESVSGIAGYSIEWTLSSTTVLDETVDTTGLTSDLLGVAEGVHYFYIRAIDGAGNPSAQLQVRYYIDRTAPEVMIFNLNGGQVLQQSSVYQVFFNVNDLFSGWQNLEVAHFYSVDDGNFWYPAQCWNPNSPQCGGGGGSGQFYWRVPWVPPESQVLYRIVATDQAGNTGEKITDDYFWIITSTDTDELPSLTQYALDANVPNPFNPQTTIRYALPEAAEVRLEILDVRGRLVRTLVAEHQTGPARHQVVWNGTDDNGRTVASGVYIYRLRAGGFVESRRMALVK